jgi:hypothetical protein
MSSVLRAFIRESLQQEAIGQIRFIQPTDERGKYQTAKMADSVTPVTNVLSGWLGSALGGAVSRLGFLNPLRIASTAVSGVVKAALKKPARVVKAAGAAVAGYEILKYFAPDAVGNAATAVKGWLDPGGTADDSVVQEEFAESTGDFVQKLIDIIQKSDMMSKLIVKQQSYDSDALKRHFDGKVICVGNSSDYDKFFTQLNEVDDMKSEVDSLLNFYTNGEQKKYFTNIAYNVLLFSTASSLPEAYARSVDPFQAKLDANQQKEVGDYITRMSNNISNKTTFAKAKEACEALGLNTQQ